MLVSGASSAQDPQRRDGYGCADRDAHGRTLRDPGGLGDRRPAWLKDIIEESLEAVLRDVDFHGVCLFPGVDMPNWHSGEWLHNGTCDLVEADGDLKRVPFDPYVAELREWQKRLNRVTELDEDPLSVPVDLGDIVEAAERLKMQPDKDRS